MADSAVQKGGGTGGCQSRAIVHLTNPIPRRALAGWVVEGPPPGGVAPGDDRARRLNG